jgi:hypothetical protein
VSDGDNFHYAAHSQTSSPSLPTFMTCFLNRPTIYFHCFRGAFFYIIAYKSQQQFTGCIVYVGVKFVNKFATVALLCVIFSIIAVYTGIFTNVHGNDKLK